MRDIRSKIFAADDKPSAAQLAVQLTLDDAGHLAVLLRLEDALHVGHLLYGRVGDRNNDALLLRLHVGVSNKHLLGGAALLGVALELFLVAHDCITYQTQYIIDHHLPTRISQGRAGGAGTADFAYMILRYSRGAGTYLVR